MRSGTGRHRRPRQAPAFVVTAGVTGAGLALPLLGAGSASAVSDGAWDRAAECESGGDWSANTGNGYYGGFQLTLEMWEAYGGLDIAPRPDLASREQQISVVERMLADQGQEALPGCALLSGLWEEFRAEREAADGQTGEEAGGGTEEQAGGQTGTEADTGTGGTAEDNGGADGSSAGQESGRGGQEEERGTGGDTGDAEDTSDTGDTGDTGDAGDTRTGEAGASESSPESGGSGAAEERDVPPAEAGTGRHRGAPDPDEERRAGESGGGRHAARGGQDGQRYEVRRGDTLSAIAAEHDVPGGWPALYRANESVVGGDPDLIFPGQRLDLAVPEC